MSCGCKKNNCQTCNKYTGCYVEILSTDIVPALTYVLGLDANGCWKYSSPLVQNTYLGCDSQPILNGQQIARCAEVDAKVATAISALRIVGCDNVPVALNTPVVKCSELSAQVCQALSALASTPFVWGGTELVTAGCQKAIIPQITNQLSISGGNVISNVNGVISQAPLPLDVQVTNATIAGTILTVTESNGDINSVDLVSILDALLSCGNVPFNHVTDRIVKCDQFDGLITNDVSLAGTVLTSVVNGHSDTVDLASIIPAPIVYRGCDNVAINPATDLLVKCAEFNGLITNDIALAGTVLTSTVNGHADAVDLASIIPAPVSYKSCDNSVIDPVTDLLIKCTQLDGLITNDLSIVGNQLSSTVNGHTDTVTLPVPTIPTELAITANAPLTGNGLVASPLDIDFSALSVADRCDLGNNIIETAQITQFLGKSSNGCLTQLPIDCACDDAKPYSSFGVACVNGAFTNAQFRERYNSAIL